MTSRRESWPGGSDDDGKGCDKACGFAAEIVQEAMREVQASLREQAARHSLEQDVLIERLAVTMGEKLAILTGTSASSTEDLHLELLDDAPDFATPAPAAYQSGHRAADSNGRPPPPLDDAPAFAKPAPAAYRSGHLAADPNYKARRPAPCLLEGQLHEPDSPPAGARMTLASSSCVVPSTPARRSGSKMLNKEADALAKEFGGVMEARGSRLSDKDVYQSKAFTTDLNGGFQHSKLCRLERALVESLNIHESEGRVSALIWSLLSHLRRLSAAHEPQRQGSLARFVDGKSFRIWFTLCICLNAVFLTYTTDYEMAHINKGSSDVIQAVEIIFVICYVVELALKLCVHRLYLFWCPDAYWNMFDFTVVSISVVEMGFTIFTQESFASNISIMRAFRLFRLAKILRIFRSVRMFAELRLMFDCVLGSFVSLMWCFIMIMMIIFVFSLFIVQNIAQDIASDEYLGSDAQKSNTYVCFGSVGAAMLTLLKSTTSGVNWGEILDMLEVSHEYAAWSFLAFILFFALAAWNIVTSLFIEKALKLAKPDLDTIAMENNVKDAADARELTAMFSVVDADGSGTISLEEMRTLMHHSKFRSYLRARDIDIADAEFFYNMLVSFVGDSEPEIEISVVVAACLRMKGVATSMDLHALNFESKLMNRRLRQHMRDSVGRLDRIEGAMKELIMAAPFSEEEELYDTTKFVL